MDIFPSGILLSDIDKNNLLRYNFRYTIGMDTFNMNPIMKYLSDETISFKVNNIDSNIMSKYIFMYNKHSIYNMFTKTTSNNVLLNLNELKDIAVKANCVFIHNNIEEFLKNVKSNLVVDYTTYLIQLIDSLINDDNIENKEFFIKMLSKDIVRIANYFHNELQRFWYDYDIFISMLYKDLNELLANRLRKRLNDDSIKVCNIILLYPERIDEIWDLNDFIINEKRLFAENIKYSFIDHLYNIKICENTEEYIDKFSIKYNRLTKYERVFSSLNIPMKYLKKMNFICKRSTFYTYKEIIDEFHNMLNSFSENNNYKLFNTFILPYQPLLIGIEYNKKIYKIVMNDSIDKFKYRDARLNELVYFSEDNIEVVEYTNKSHINSIFYNYNDDKYVLYDMAKKEVEQVNKFNNININENKLLIYKKYNIKYNFRTYDFNSFYKDLYASIIEIVWNSILMYYKDGKIKERIEECFSEKAFQYMNNDLKECVCNDEDKYGIRFIIKSSLNINDTLTLSNAVNTNYITYVNVLTFTHYWLDEVLSNPIINNPSINKPVIGLEIILLAIDKNDNYLSVDDLISLDKNDKDRNIIYKRFDYNNNTVNSYLYLNESPFFIDYNTNTLYDILRKPLLNIIREYISDDNFIYIVDKVYNKYLEYISNKNCYTYNYSSFKDLKIESEYFNKDGKGIFELKYY